MKTWVLDASVVVKWFMTDAENESDLMKALELLTALRNDNLQVLQPVHWLIEVAAVITRLQPDHAQTVISALYAMELPIGHDPIILNLACRLSKKYHHHLFDTLYHAVALSQENATLVTADVVYFNKTSQEGKIILLSELE